MLAVSRPMIVDEPKVLWSEKTPIQYWHMSLVVIEPVADPKQCSGAAR